MRLKMWVAAIAVAGAVLGGAVYSLQAAEPLAAGVSAPAFTLPDQDRKMHNLGDYRGKWVALAFYPADMTSGCTLEARSVTASLPELKNLGIQPLGISVQDTDSKKEFCDKEGIEYPLLADVDKEVSEAYGVLNDAGYSNRVTFIIDPNGRIVRTVQDVDVRNHGKQVADLVSRLQQDVPDYRPRTEGIANLKPGDKAPLFYLPNLLGENSVALNDLLKDGANKGIVVIWVSPQCPVSRAYEGRMKELAARYREQKIAFVGIDSNSSYDDTYISDHFNKVKPGFPILRDPENVIADDYGARVTPEAFLIDSNGYIRYHGALDDSQDPAGVKESFLDKAIANYLADRPINPQEKKAFGCALKRAKK